MAPCDPLAAAAAAMEGLDAKKAIKEFLSSGTSLSEVMISLPLKNYTYDNAKRRLAEKRKGILNEKLVDKKMMLKYEGQDKRSKMRRLALMSGVGVTLQAGFVFAIAGTIHFRLNEQVDDCHISSNNVTQWDECKRWDSILIPFVSVTGCNVAFGLYVKWRFGKISGMGAARAKVMAFGYFILFGIVLVFIIIPLMHLLDFFDRKAKEGGLTAQERLRHNESTGEEIKLWMDIGGWLFIASAVLTLFGLCTSGYMPPPEEGKEALLEAKAKIDEEKKGTPPVLKLFVAIRNMAVGLGLRTSAPNVEARISDRIKETWTTILSPVFMGYALGIVLMFVSAIFHQCYPSTVEEYHDRVKNETKQEQEEVARKQKHAEKEKRRQKRKSRARLRAVEAEDEESEDEVQRIGKMQKLKQKDFTKCQRSFWNASTSMFFMLMHICILCFSVQMVRWQEYERYSGRPLFNSGLSVSSWLYTLGVLLSILAVSLFGFYCHPAFLISCARAADQPLNKPKHSQVDHSEDEEETDAQAKGAAAGSAKPAAGDDAAGAPDNASPPPPGGASSPNSREPYQAYTAT